MKKLLFLFSLVFMLASCGACHKKEEVKPIQQDSTIVADSVIKADLDSMVAKYGDKDFRWYESLILTENYLDEDSDIKIAELVNVYQIAEGGDPYVYKTQHVPGATYTDSIKGFWIEDFPLNYADLKVSYDSACAIVAKVNFPVPHSRHICLRNPMGPMACNPQWVFGNTQKQIWVDAVTGDTSDSNPAFPKGFKMPLGEWP